MNSRGAERDAGHSSATLGLTKAIAFEFRHVQDNEHRSLSLMADGEAATVHAGSDCEESVVSVYVQAKAKLCTATIEPDSPQAPWGSKSQGIETSGCHARF
jgi:hypothetical protein